MKSLNSFDCLKVFTNHLALFENNKHSKKYFSLRAAAEKLNFNINKLPFSLKVLFENVLRNEDGVNNTKQSLKAFKHWLDNSGKTNMEIGFMPARVLMQDFTGVPAIVDLAAMRDCVKNLGGNPEAINPQIPVDLVIDHSVQVDFSSTNDSFEKNVEKEIYRNKERYEFLKWGQSAFDNFKVVPPGTGICHQVNLEYLAKVVWDEANFVYPDTLVGTDSHTTMINGLSVLGWGVGGIEAEAAMLGEALQMIIPEVIGVKLTGSIKPGITATDVVLTITQMLRKFGVVGKFVEFYGEGVKNLSLADRATISNMAPEYGATCGFFPIDEETIKYLKLTGRENIDLIENYAKEQAMWLEDDEGSVATVYTHTLNLDLSDVNCSLSGPKRPQDRIDLTDVSENFKHNFSINATKQEQANNNKLGNGSVVIAAITSCTNTSNPSVMIAAGLLAKKATQLGGNKKQWVKTSLAPGSQVVTSYLEKSGLNKYLDELGFNLVGYGCTTCIGNSGPLSPEVEQMINDDNLTVAAVLSGNRNFEGRIHPLTKANYLASPPLVIAYAIAGNVNIDLSKDPLFIGKNGKKVFLKDIWPTNQEISDVLNSCVTAEMFREKYQNVFTGSKAWQDLKVEKTSTYNWQNSTYINNPPFFKGMKKELEEIKDIKNAQVLAIFGDSITTDHISPAGSISLNSPAAKYLESKGVYAKDFNSYGSRRGNHEVMMRGTFANIRIKNELCPSNTGGFTIYRPTGQVMNIYNAAMEYQKNKVPLVVIAGKEYGTGSSRDWAAKGTMLLGVKAVIAESFERIHRSNLIGMGVLPLKFIEEATRHNMDLHCMHSIDLIGLDDIAPYKLITCIVHISERSHIKINLELQAFTNSEIEYLKNKTILHTIIRQLI